MQYQSKGQSVLWAICAFEPLFLFSTWIFCSLDGPEESSWQFRAALAAFTRGETSQGVESRRDLRQHHQKLKSVTFLNIWQHEKPYCAWCSPSSSSLNIWLLKLFLVWKPWSNLLLWKPPSPCSVFWVPDAAVVLPAPDPCWFVASKWQQIFPWPVSCVCEMPLDGTFSQTFLLSAVQLVHSWWEVQGNLYF